MSGRLPALHYPTRLNPQRIFAITVLGLAAWLLRSFLVPFMWAIVIGVASWPLYRRATRLLPERLRARVAPALFTALITCAVLGPLVFAFAVVTQEAQAWAAQMLAAAHSGLLVPAWLKDIPLIGDSLADTVNSAATAWVNRDAGAHLRSMQSAGQFLAHHAFVVSITVVALYSLFRHGESLAALIAQGVPHLLGEAGGSYVGIAIAALRATTQSMVLVGLLDGMVLWGAYAAVHVPAAAAWGAVTGIAATLPFLGYLAVAVVCIELLARGAGSSALLIAILGVGILFTNDKFVRPVLISGRARLNFLEALMGTIGGLQAFGLLGLFMGPVVLALAVAICRRWLPVPERHAAPLKRTATPLA
ncbi:MAG TPA: AI-2E family transporter [Steroidobacteraceae bacterium]|nr:AI-2E family transporter [Steroidobacteraceae bacterium]